MKKSDLTPEFIRERVLDYIINSNFPDELYDIGSIVMIDDLVDVDVESVKKIGPHFMVEGTGTVETTTDMGEGDSASGSYPIRFGYEFDEEGEIIRRHKQRVDTRSFYEGSDLDEYLIESLTKDSHSVFRKSIEDIQSLLEAEIGTQRGLLLHLLYVNVITAVESYLSDFFITRVKEDRELFNKFVEKNPEFQHKRVPMSEVIKAAAEIEQTVNSYLLEFVWHRFERVKLMFKDVLGIGLPGDMSALFRAVVIRHDLVHRNGKKPDGSEHIITDSDIKKLIEAAENFIEHIEDEWNKNLPF